MPPAPLPKEDTLFDIHLRMEQAYLPLQTHATQLVFGRGNPNARVLLIGEGPGYFEDKEGKPFVGNAGKMLDAALKEIGLDPEHDVYVTNVVHHRPPGNRDPLPHEIAAYRPYLKEIIAAIDPSIIVTLGRYSMGMFLPNMKISKIHGTLFIVGRRTILPMFHPAAALRSEEVLHAFQLDFQRHAKLLQDPSVHRESTPQGTIPHGHSNQLDLFS